MTKAITKTTVTQGERFLSNVERQFTAQLGRTREMNPLEQRLTQHMFLSVDQALKKAEADRAKNPKRANRKPYTWDNVNLTKLATDTTHRVSLGLDALVPNHISPIAYWNSALEQYDIDLRIGYVGRSYVTRKFAVDTPVNIIHHLVYDTDEFEALPHSVNRDIESYRFKINEPFNRGKIVGGFGYIVYDDPRKNQLVLVTMRDFERSRKASEGGFWATNDVEMHLKTVHHRTADKIVLDPSKVNAEVLESARKDDPLYALEVGEDEVSRIDNETQEVVRTSTMAVLDIDGDDDDVIDASVKETEKVPEPKEPEPVKTEAPKEAAPVDMFPEDPPF